MYETRLKKSYKNGMEKNMNTMKEKGLSGDILTPPILFRRPITNK